jgi:beta-lactamase regulating signal transducer with metallopeptidase domain
MNSILVALVSVLFEFSLITLLILLGRNLALKVAGPLWTYRLWYIPVAYLTLNTISQYVPIKLASNQSIPTLNTHTFVQEILPTDNNDVYLQIALSLWLIVSFACFMAFMSKYWLTIRDLKSVHRVFTTRKLNKHNVQTAYSDEITTPATYGLLKPKLLLPSNFHIRYTRLQQELILEHELNHVQRRDNLFNVIWLFCCCLFWFNPLSYLAWRAFRLDQELSCDFLTLQKRSNEEKVTYGELIVSMSNRQNMTPMHCSIHSPFNQTMERVKMLKKTLKSKKSRLIGAILMCTYATGGLVLAQNDIVAQDSIRYVINDLNVIKHYNNGSLSVDIDDPFESEEDEDYLLGFWHEENPQRVAVRFDTHRAVSGELLTIVNIDSYKNHQARESKKLVFIGDHIQHSIEFAENEITDEAFKLDFQVQNTQSAAETSNEEKKEQFVNWLRYDAG